MSIINIRQAVTADRDAIAANNISMAMETEERQLDPEKVKSGVARLLADPARGVYYVAESGQRVVGQMLITREWSDWRDGWFWWIQSVFIAHKARRMGVYRRLHEHVESQARAAGDVRGLRLYVDLENTRAQRVYERMGMRQARYRFYEVDWSGEE